MAESNDLTLLVFDRQLEAAECDDITRMLKCDDAQFIKWSRVTDQSFQAISADQNFREAVRILAELGNKRRLRALTLIVAQSHADTESLVILNYSDCYVGKAAGWLVEDTEKRKEVLSAIKTASAIVEYAQMLQSGDEMLLEFAPNVLVDVADKALKDQILQSDLDTVLQLQNDLVRAKHAHGHLIK